MLCESFPAVWLTLKVEIGAEGRDSNGLRRGRNAGGVPENTDFRKRWAGMMTLNTALQTLADEFRNLEWDFRTEDMPDGRESDNIVSYWPGKADDDIMICVLRSRCFDEPFHRQDFFFFNYAYEGDYYALSSQYDNLIRVSEGECYIGQPYSGYALKSSDPREEKNNRGKNIESIKREDTYKYRYADPEEGDQDRKSITIIGVLVRREAFFREYLSTLASDNRMYRFFLEPQNNRVSESFIHLTFEDGEPVRELLEMMVREYAEHRADGQQILKPLVLALIMQLARRHREVEAARTEETLIEKLEHYIRDHMESVTLDSMARDFAYHPNYISSLLREKSGKRFLDILLEKRMERSALLLKGTELSIEEISSMVGYKNSSSFYKAFHKYYGVSPRMYQT